MLECAIQKAALHNACKTTTYRENLCEIQWNKNENTELRDIVNLHADDLQN